MKTVAVIGGGPAGLCAARHLLQSKLKPIVFEQQDCVGGTWVYQDVDKNNPKDVFSSLYDNMRTNLPRQVMEFPDYPFDDDYPTFLHHTVVRKYIECYAEHFKLYPHIRFNMRVTSVLPSQMKSIENSFIKWCVQSQNLMQDNHVTEEFDAVVVCNGHSSQPRYPTIKGLDNFNGEIIHSHYYRRQSDFAKKTVLVLGAGPSGRDISLELATTCERIYLSHRGERIEAELPSNVIEVCDIDFVSQDGSFVFKDGSLAAAHVLLLCTGYKYVFPFLNSESGICVADGVVKTLYKHLFNIKYPSMSFVGLPFKCTPLPMFHQQCAYLASVYSGKKTLPSTEEMSADTEKEKAKKLTFGIPERYFHQMGIEQFSYNDKLAEMSGNNRNAEVIKDLYIYNSTVRRKNLQHYKNCSYRVLNNKEFEVL